MSMICSEQKEKKRRRKLWKSKNVSRRVFVSELLGVAMIGYDRDSSC